MACYQSQSTVFTFPVGLAIGALLGSIIINEVKYTRKAKDDKIKLYSRLKGEKHVLIQWFSSFVSGSIYIENNRGIKELMDSSSLKENPKAIKLVEKIDLDDPTLRIRCDDHSKELSITKEKLAKDLGFAEILFDDLQLRGLIDAIENAECAIDKFEENLEKEIENGEYRASISAPPDYFFVDYQWQKKKLYDLNILVTALERAMDNLLNILRSSI